MSSNLYCEFCQSEFKSLSNLNYHQKTAKYCLILQNKNIIEQSNFECEYCLKKFTTKIALTLHIKNCYYKENLIQKENTNKELYNIKNEYESLKKELNELKEKYKDYDKIKDENFTLKTKEYFLKEMIDYLKENQNKNENMMNKMIENTGSKNFYQTNIINKNNIIQNLQPISNNMIKQQSENITKKDLKNGAKSLAKFAFENVYKDRVYITDISRKTFVFKDQNGNIIKDKNGLKSINNFIDNTREKVLDTLFNLQGEFDRIPSYKRDDEYQKNVINLEKMIVIFKNKNNPNDSECFDSFHKTYSVKLFNLLYNYQLKQKSDSTTNNNFINSLTTEEKEYFDYNESKDDEEKKENSLIFDVDSDQIEHNYITLHKDSILKTLKKYSLFLDENNLSKFKESNNIMAINNLINYDNVSKNFYKQNEFTSLFKPVFKTFEFYKQKALDEDYIDENDINIINDLMKFVEENKTQN